ncbi:alpha/beta hydrolase fold domain-containing protein [Arthrobacter sp. NPDC058130]|uniref:alpha/beta hydrolase n=1 Tax=Arthrobacter sp. NPDC058130 TaxID=3346353 RepID=UPI0036E6F443
MKKHVLEASAQGIADATSKPPFLYQLGPEGARKILDDIQAAPTAMPDVDEKWLTIPADVGDLKARIVRPKNAEAVLPPVLYIHGGGWILGNAGTHDRLVRELAVGADAAIVFVAPEVAARRERGVLANALGARVAKYGSKRQYCDPGGERVRKQSRPV